MRTRTALVVISAVAAAVTVLAPGRPEAAVPESQRVVMFTDSVGLGARTALPRAFPADWSVHVDGEPARFVEQLEHDFVRPRLASDPEWFGDHVVIAGGYNYPYWDPDRFDRSIDSIVSALTDAGVAHVYWVTLREVKPEFVSPAAWRQIQPYSWYFPAVNEHLRSALDRHANLRLVDWAAVADRPGITYDAIHLNNAGAELYSRTIRNAVDAAATAVPDRSTTRVSVPGAAGAAAVAVNITTTEPRRHGHLRVWDCDGDPPLVAVHHHRRAETVAHAAIAPVNAAGEFCIFARTSTNLVVDATAVFADGALAGSPSRWHDARTSSGVIAPGATMPVHVDDVVGPAGLAGRPDAVAIVATAVDPEDAGWLRAAPCDTAAAFETANVNHPAGATTSNLVVVEPDPGGAVCITSRSRTHIVVDLLAAFPSAAGVEADHPIRWFDSRELGPAPAGGTVTVLDVADVGASPDRSLMINLSGVSPSGPGYATAYPCAEGRPLAAALNVGRERVTSNAVIVRPDTDGRLCIHQHTAMHLVVDLMATLDSEVVTGIAPTRVLDTRDGRR